MGDSINYRGERLLCLMLNSVNYESVMKEAVRRLRMEGIKLAPTGKSLAGGDVERMLNTVAAEAGKTIEDVMLRRLAENIMSKKQALSIPMWLTGYFLDTSVVEVIITGPSKIVLRRTDGKFDPTTDAFDDPLHLLYSLNMILKSKGMAFNTQSPGVYLRIDDQTELVVLMPPLAESQILVSIRFRRGFR